ncbi:TauD/TfdA family dioxygenase, partial [Falsiroseomonas oryzae]|uniref:TauD/TfdA family dioxygenase n=1 Tax=Falsiroseomonas oryzae TaxID=2766473 RepID=UPI0022EB5C5C
APLPRLGGVLRQAATRLDTGRGFALLRGLSLDRLGEAGAEALLPLLGAHLGRAVPQGPGGEIVQRLASPATDQPRWRFHADAADIVALLVLRQPPEMDPAMLVAAATVHNELLKRDRAALERLYAPLPHLLMGAVGVAPAAVQLPVFTMASGAFVGRYARDAIEAAEHLPGAAPLSTAQIAALDLLDAIAAEPGLALRVEVRPGDVLLLNPLQVWKRRAEAPSGEAGAEASESGTRQALRLLLVTPNSRALPQGMVAIGEGTAAGGGMVGG